MEILILCVLFIVPKNTVDLIIPQAGIRKEITPAWMTISMTTMTKVRLHHWIKQVAYRVAITDKPNPFRFSSEYDSEGSNYKPSYEDLDSPAQKHSRRPFAKKKKAKEIEPKGGRYYYEMERDQFGQPILPVEIDSWTVINLGVVDAERPAFHTARYIYPIGYTIKK